MPVPARTVGGQERKLHHLASPRTEAICLPAERILEWQCLHGLLPAERILEWHRLYGRESVPCGGIVERGRVRKPRSMRGVQLPSKSVGHGRTQHSQRQGRGLQQRSLRTGVHAPYAELRFGGAELRNVAE